MKMVIDSINNTNRGTFSIHNSIDEFFSGFDMVGKDILHTKLYCKYWIKRQFIDNIRWDHPMADGLESIFYKMKE